MSHLFAGRDDHKNVHFTVFWDNDQHTPVASVTVRRPQTCPKKFIKWIETQKGNPDEDVNLIKKELVEGSRPARWTFPVSAYSTVLESVRNTFARQSYIRTDWADQDRHGRAAPTAEEKLYAQREHQAREDGDLALLPDHIVKLFTEFKAPAQPSDQSLSDALGPVWDMLYEYQKVGVRFAVARKRCMLGDQMGLGKTIQSITASAVISPRARGSVLVICPASLRTNWRKEVCMWSPRAFTFKLSGAGLVVDAPTREDPDRTVTTGTRRMFGLSVAAVDPTCLCVTDPVSGRATRVRVLLGRDERSFREASANLEAKQKARKREVRLLKRRKGRPRKSSAPVNPALLLTSEETRTKDVLLVEDVQTGAVEVALHRSLRAAPDPEVAVWHSGGRWFVGPSTPHFTRDNVHVIPDGSDPVDRSDVVYICSYSLAGTAKMSAKLQALRPAQVICDESHYLQNNKSKRFKAVRKICKHARALMLLTGTPMSKTRHMYSQLLLLDKDQFPRFWNSRLQYWNEPSSFWPSAPLFFAAYFCAPKLNYVGNGRSQYVFEGSANSRVLNAVLRHRVMVRRTLEDAGLELPDKVRVRVAINIHKPGEMEKLEGRMKEVAAVREEKGSRYADPMYMELLRETSRLKLEGLVEFQKQNLAQMLLCDDPTDKGMPSKCIIFAHHRFMLEAAQEAVQSMGVGCIMIHGGTTHKRRAELFETFETHPKVRVAVLSIQACGTGLNITCASHTYVWELLCDQRIHEQSEKRTHRIGATSTCFIHYLVAEGTMDDAVWRSLNRKTRNAGMVIDGRHTSLNTGTRYHAPDEDTGMYYGDDGGGRESASRQRQSQSQAIDPQDLEFI